MVHYTTATLICSLLLVLYSVCGLCLPQPVHGAKSGYRGRDFDEHYDVVFPRRVSHNGEFISHLLTSSYHRPHHLKKKARHGPRDALHYIIPIRGNEHHVELHPSARFMSPGMVVERFKKDINDRIIERVNETQCHYTGFVRGDKDSKVAISTCHGLTGYIRTKRHYFFIEPAEGRSPALTPFTKRAHPHYVRINRNNDVNGNKCETWDDVAKVMAKMTETRQSRGDGINQCLAELHIETLVVMDRSMLNYHKEIDLENYILTVFNMAHDLFHDASLGTNIDLAIVRIIRLEEEDHEMNMNVNKDAEKTLDYFREWQNKVNPKEDTHPNHHDVAVLITRVDICGADSTCGLLGASKIGGMCDPQNQAAICEDNGLRLGFVIAHEIAHTLAILHDTLQESGCSGTYLNNLTTVMDPSISIKTAGWSRCSNKFLSLFVESGFGKCLYDPPTEHSFKPVDMLPGVMYDGDFQCRELLGPNAALCMTGVDCENLICYMEDKGCVETNAGVAPGTKCGDKKWCFHGVCIQVGEREGAIDGGWGPWSEWSDCSRTCGSGVAWQERHCDSPAPANGGRYCSGERKRHKICSTEPCDANLPSFRDVQCSEFNSWVYPEDGKVHSWKNYPMHDENPCVLFCINDWGDIASLRPRVIDGTSCQRGMRDICIDGLCKPFQEIPCDLDLESNAVEDVCGVCRGDSSSCDVVKGEITVPCCGHIKEERVLCIPRNASNIKVEEMMPTESRIQIRSGNGETVYIVGNVIGSFNVPGTYAWVGNIRTKQEAIAIPGPLTEEISLWLVVTENVTIIYSYGVPAKKKRTPLFSWDYLGWNPCSAGCGPGVQESIPSCVEKVGGLVDDMYCRCAPKPIVQIKACEITPCVNRWFVGDWGPCKKCPKGRRYRVVKCIRPTGEGEGEVVFIADLNCVGPKPKSWEPCVCFLNGKDKHHKHHHKKRSSFSYYQAVRRSALDGSSSNVSSSHSEGGDAVTSGEINVKPHNPTRVGASDSTCYILTVNTPQYYTTSDRETSVETTLSTRNQDDANNKQPETTETTDFCDTNYTISTNDTSNDSMTISSMNLSFQSESNGSITTTTDNFLSAYNYTAPHCPVYVEYDDEPSRDDFEEGEEHSDDDRKFNIANNFTNEFVNMSFPPDVITTCIIDYNATLRKTTTSTTTTTQTTETTECTTEAILVVHNEKAEMCSKIAALMGKTAVDKECISNISLTVHTELENGRRPEGLPPVQHEEDEGKPTYTIKGKEAMKFLNIMQKDFDNNKTKIRKK